jgi:hypothetical protein
MYKLLDDGRFKIEDYQKSTPFSSFLPGLAGTDGIPMWAFYVNRGQGIASFGVENKDNAMTEFYPADKTYQLISTTGFRTFLKGKSTKESFQYEPFAEENEDILDTMIIEDNRLKLTHENTKYQLKVEVLYYTLPHQSIPGLIREVTLINTGQEPLELELVDGLASVFPAGVSNSAYKEIGNTYKSWFDANILDDSLAYYFLRGSTEDEAEVSQNDKGNFYVSLLEKNKRETFLSPIVDREWIFGNDLSLQKPLAFFKGELEDKNIQVTTNKVSGAFSKVADTLKGGEQLTLSSLFGQSTSREAAIAFKEQHISADAFRHYRTEAATLAKELTQKVETKTALPEFDAYVTQNYLDNGLRGGFPFLFENEKSAQVFYLYSRKHGDLERDYNFFSISPEYYSQGNGNYRDMNQNRRLDSMMEPKLGDRTIRQFMNLIQLDGYNPLALKTVRFTLTDASFPFEKYGLNDKTTDALKEVTQRGYTPGNIKGFIEDMSVELAVPFESFLTDLLSASEEVLEAEHGEGFWSDHWTYNIDLIESYLEIYPDKVKEFFLEDGYRFFDSPAHVQPQKEKYHVKENGEVRQYKAIVLDEEKAEKQAKGEGLWVTIDGKVYTTNLLSKLMLLITNKTATLAPFGLGIEMEGGKPGWNDAMNGLPGMLGSGTSELYELKRLIKLLQQEVSFDGEIALPKEAMLFIEKLASSAKDWTETTLLDWQERTRIREEYRALIRNGLSGEIVKSKMNELNECLSIFAQVVNQAIQSVESFDSHLVPTYFRFDVTMSENKEITDVKAIAVTPFLEGIVKKLKTLKDSKEAKELYQKVRESGLYDQKLGMYKTSESIKDEPIELGRAKFFTPGWLENESIFLHMSYKYLLELIKSGLIDEFFTEMKTGILPFVDPKVYGRSILENSSFLASSANPDPSLHGRGFVARLSGSTVEFLSMWKELFFGHELFHMNEEVLTFQLKPTLSEEFFPESGEVSVRLFGDVEVIYQNKERKPTFGKQAVTPKAYTLLMENGEVKHIEDSVVSGELANAIREKKVQRIEVKLA